MKTKFIPQRKCIVCGNRTDKNLLTRIATDGENYFADFSYKASGRGVYVCKNAECPPLLLKKNALARAFRKKVTEDKYNSLIKELI